MRRPPPIQEERGGLQNERLFKSRTCIAQITSVDTANGRVAIRVNTTNEGFTLQIPLGGFSIKGLASSWIRYMPQDKDCVKVSFGPDNSPEIVGYAAFGEEFDPNGKRQGSPAVPRQGLYATVRRLADANVDGLGTIFRELKQGEWDMRSAGGAEIYGTRNGTLTLAGGAGAQLRLIKERQESVGRANLTLSGGDGVEVRFGTVKRKTLPTNASESEVTANTAGAPAPKEWKVRLAYLTPPAGAPELPLYEHVYGDVRDSRGLPELASGSALRSRAIWYNAAGVLETLSVRVDALGNVDVTQSEQAVARGLNLSSNGITPLSTNFSRTVLTSTFQHAIVSQLVTIGSEGAFESFILGNSFVAALNVFLGLKFAESTALATFATAVASFASNCVTTDMGATAGAVSTAGNALGPLAGAASGGATNMIQSGLDALSAKIFGE